MPTDQPKRPAKRYSYSVKYVCGLQKDQDKRQDTVRPGSYATDINIHNYHGREIPIEKFVIPLVFEGEPVGREPQVMGPKGQDRIVLPPDTATMDDCQRISELLFGGPAPSPLLMVGFLEIVSPEELGVTAVYTATDERSSSLSIDVEQIDGKPK